MEFLVQRRWGFLSKELFCSDRLPCTHFKSFPKPAQNFLAGKAFILRIITNESEKVLEKCDLQC